MARRSRADAGFTLVEVVAALLILSALGSAASLFFGPWRERSLLLSETRGTAQWLERVRGQAILSGAPSTVVLSEAGTRLVANDGADARHQALPTALRGGQALVFQPDGGARSGELVIGTPTRSAVIRIEGITGRVRVLEQAHAR